MKLTIVSPVYGVSSYIECFLKSLLPQLTPEVEVILVNDGTKDNSVELAKNLINQLPFALKENVIILHQDNQGQSVARNNAIRQARGEYIGFLDPDDYVEPNYILTILELLQSSPDVASFGAKAFLDDSNTPLHEIYTNLNEGLNSATEDLLSTIYNECSWMPWLRVIKKEFFINDSFPKSILLEDVYLFSIMYLKVKTINHSNEVLVNYRVRAGSSVGQKNDLFFESYRQVISYLIENKELSPLIDLTLNKLFKSYFQESLNSRGLRFALLNMQKIPKSKGNKLFMIYRACVYFVKKMLGKNL